MIRSYIIMSGHGALLVITKLTCGMQGDQAREQLAEKGVTRYIAFEIPTVRVQERYGARFDIVENRVDSEDALRVLDINGIRVLNNFEFREMGEPIFVGEGDRITQ
ncbi:hypothetical protein ACQZV8_07130 [Magnetococcales bacterium HHB-1]